jgi:MFS family permease
MSRVTLAWMFGSVWFTIIMPGAALNGFGDVLGASEKMFGLIAAAPALATLAGIPGSWLIEVTGQRRKVFLICLLVQRILTAALVLFPLAFGLDTPAARATFIVTLLIMWALQNIGGPGWVSWMADLVPARIRGRYFARRRQLGMATSVPAALIVGELLNRYAGSDMTPWLLILIFLAATVFGILDIGIFLYIPDRKRPTHHTTSTLARLGAPLRSREFMFGTLFGAMSNLTWLPMSMFVFRLMTEDVRASPREVQLYLIAIPMLAMLLCLPVWGAAVDRMGRKPLLALTTLGLIPVGVLWSATESANFQLILAFSRNAGAAYTVVNGLAFAAFGTAGAILSGWFLDRVGAASVMFAVPGVGEITGFDMLMLLLAGARVAQLFLLPLIHEPDAAPVSTTAVYVGRSILRVPSTWIR